jgi:hypothetical protein
MQRKRRNLDIVELFGRASGEAGSPRPGTASSRSSKHQKMTIPKTAERAVSIKVLMPLE